MHSLSDVGPTDVHLKIEAIIAILDLHRIRNKTDSPLELRGFDGAEFKGSFRPFLVQKKNRSPGARFPIRSERQLHGEFARTLHALPVGERKRFSRGKTAVFKLDSAGK